MMFQSKQAFALPWSKTTKKAAFFLKNDLLRPLRKYILILEDKIQSRFHLIDLLVFTLSKERLYPYMDRERSLENILHTVYNYSGYWAYRRIFPQQILCEIQQLAKEVKKVSPSTILEIGTSNGGTLYVWSRYLESCQRIISIDLPEAYPYAKMKFFELFDTNKKFYFLRSNSHNRETLARLSQLLKNDKIDFLFIDGDHSYNGVKQDFEMYKQFVASGGIIGFHDIVYHPDYGVNMFWNEIKHNYASKEIIASKKQVGYGIGILYV
jgi:predicted O-methyltransferase YrrM